MYNRFHPRRRLLMAAGSALLLGACASRPAPPVAASTISPAPLHGAALAAIDKAIDAAIARHGMPGAQFHLERDGAVFERSYGKLAYDGAGAAVAVSDATLYDVASLTKVLATAPAVLLLAEQGKLDLEAPLARYLPACGGRGRDGLTLRHLLTHSSGFPAGLPGRPPWEGRAAALALACGKDITDPPGTAFRYSDINYILLGLVVEQAAGMPLDRFASRHLFAPLGMQHTGFLPLQRFAATTIAPTHVSPASDKLLHPDLHDGTLLQGVVHDPTARRMGGVAGSAGLFSTAADIARFARMLQGEGVLDGVRVLSAASVRLLTTVQSPPGLSLRAMGMDIDSPFARPRGQLFPVSSFGHTGFTGCFLWVDGASHTFYILLSNRVYPDDKANILPLYGELGTLAARAVGLGEVVP